MPFDPFRAFEVGQQLGKSKRSSLGRAVGGVLETVESESGEERKFQRDVRLTKAKARAEVEATRDLFPGLTGQNGDMALAGVRASGKPFYRSKSFMKEQAGMRAEAESQKREKVGVSADVAGRLSSATEAIRALNDMKRILYPGGTPESFNLPAAFYSRPTVFTKGRPIPTYEGQTLSRRGGQAAAGKLLVQSGVQTRESEYQRLGEQLVANALTNPKAGFQALDEGIRFYSEFLQAVDPQGQFHDVVGGRDTKEQDRQKIKQAIESGDYPSDMIEAMERDFEEEYGEEL